MKMSGQEHTDEENDIAKNTDRCFFLQNPYYSEENNESWEIQLINNDNVSIVACEYH